MIPIELTGITVTRYYNDGGSIEYGDLKLVISGLFTDVKMFEADLLEFFVKYQQERKEKL